MNDKSTLREEELLKAIKELVAQNSQMAKVIHNMAPFIQIIAPKVQFGTSKKGVTLD